MRYLSFTESVDVDVDVELSDVFDEITTDELIEELSRRDAKQKSGKLHISYALNVVKDYFEHSKSNAKDVITDLLLLPHTASTEEIINELKSRIL